MGHHIVNVHPTRRFHGLNRPGPGPSVNFSTGARSKRPRPAQQWQPGVVTATDGQVWIVQIMEDLYPLVN